MKVDRALFTANHELTEKIKLLDDFNTTLLRTLNELLIENERLSERSKELETRVDTFKSVNKRHKEEIDNLRFENHALRRNLYNWEV